MDLPPPVYFPSVIQGVQKPPSMSEVIMTDYTTYIQSEQWKAKASDGKKTVIGWIQYVLKFSHGARVWKLPTACFLKHHTMLTKTEQYTKRQQEVTQMNVTLC